MDHKEEERINALKLYDVLDTLPEQEFDDITQLASEICGMPIALISLVDTDRQWFKSRVGLDTSETAREYSFCAHAIQTDESFFEVKNPTEDPRFENNPLVTGEPFIRYYAGTPLINKDGYKLGTLCVINSDGHQLSDTQKRSLKILARSVMSMLELRYREKQSNFFRNALNEVAAVSVVNQDTTFEFVNKKFCDLAEMPAEELIGKSYRDIHLADISENEHHTITEILTKGHIYHGRIKNLNKNGDVSWSQATVIPYTNSKNELVKLFTLRIDITREVQMVERLEEAEKLSRTGNWELNLVNGGRYWSKGLYQIAEYDSADAGDDSPSLLSLIAPEDKKRLDDSLADMLKGNRDKMNGEFRIVTPGKKEKDLAVTATVLQNSKGENLIVHGTVQDITEMKLAEKELEQNLNELKMAQDKLTESESKYRGLVEETSQMVFVTDRKGYYTYVSPRLKQLVERDDNEIIGTRFSFIYDQEWKRRVMEFYASQLKNDLRESIFTFPVINKSGRKIWVEQIATLVTDDKGAVTGFKCVLHDVSERIRTEEAEREVARNATAAKEAQQNFLGKMSHEIRTPMNGVVGMINLLKDSQLDQTQQIYADAIKESAENMLRIINDILDISKIESGKMVFEETIFDLRHLISRVKFTIEPAAASRNIEVRTQIDEQIPAALVADPVRLNQILLNLAGNGLKFTRQGHVGIDVKLREQNDKNVTLEFDVSDTGIGIAKDKLESIFESYTQAESSTTRQYGGTGLGLTIARQLVEQQDGTMSVRSQVGKGTTFSFTFHCKIADTQPVKANRNKSQELHSMEGRRILLVEDNLINQKVARYTLEKWGAQVTVADRGTKAIELLKQQAFDIILMDIQMPEMNGLEATQIIRQELHNNTPILAMTASAMHREKDLCLQAGMDDYFSKPFEPAALNQKLYEHLNKS